MENRKTVFISYSHADTVLLNKLKRHFSTLKNHVDFWDDSKILPGQQWRSEIEKTLNNAKIAILLISADFFNSNFIVNNELPKLLESAEKDGLIILSLILKPCLFSEYESINKYQAVNSPSNTIIQMTESEQESTFVSLILRIKEIIKDS